MKKVYIKPQTIDVTALLGEDILESSIGGQSYTPVDNDEATRDDVDFSAKENKANDFWDDNDW